MYDWKFDDDALTVWVRLRQASDTVEKVLEKGLNKHNNATLAQIDVLGILNATKAPLTIGELATHMFRQQHSVSAQISRMRRNGLVAKTRGKKDERIVTVKMQPQGEQLLKATMQIGPGQARKLLKSCLSDSEVKQLDQLLKKVRDGALQQLGEKAKPLPETFDTQRFAVE